MSPGPQKWSLGSGPAKNALLLRKKYFSCRKQFIPNNLFQKRDPFLKQFLQFFQNGRDFTTIFEKREKSEKKGVKFQW